MAIFHLLNRNTKNNTSFFSIILAVLLFSFFNGLGVFKDFENEITRNTSEFLPILLTVFGASISCFGLMIVLFVLKNLLIMIKKISEEKWIYGISFITGCIAIFIVFGKVFV